MGRAIFSLLLLALIAAGDAHVEYRSRPHYSFYTNTGDRVPIINQAGHRRAVRAAMPIPRRPTANPTTTVAPATQVPPIDESGYCHTWSQQHYRTFDGKTYNFHGACTYTLVTDCVDYSFHVYVENDLDCQDGRHNNTCYRSILIDNGNPASMIYLRPGGRAYYKNEELTLPTKAGGLVLERIAHVVLATSGLGFTILYDGEEDITIYITSDSLEGHTCGLCGVYDMDASNDFRMPSGAIASDAYTFGLSWKGMDERDPAYCPDVPTEPLRCSQYTSFESDEQQEKAEFAISECAHLLHGTFMACHQVVDPQPYITACEQDVCACEMVEQSDGSMGNDCKCAAFTAYTQECARRGYQVSWRSIDFCPFTCPADKVYDQCGSACTQKGCSTAIADCETDDTVGCIEGCHCPAGTYRSTSGECVSANQCFCAWQGNEYEPGQTISDGCNECNCIDGKWQCSNNDCGGMCQVGGLGHYHTFDSYDYDFAGTCSYTLVKDCWNPLDSSVVYIENAECGMEGASCVKAVVLHEGANVVRLRRGHQVLANGQEVTEFPVTVGNIFVNQPTQHQTAAVMSNGLTILFDGNNHVIVMADERHINSTCGLCGTYNNNQRDDFYTEAGDIESNPSSFANKWKLGTSCQDSTDDQTTDPCDLYSQKSLTAEEDCFKLYDDPAFAACRQYVDPEAYYESCRSDVCNCETGTSCKCEIFAMYASQCAQKGVVIDWRSKISGCGIDCEGGLVYSACHTMCETTCNALSSTATCDETCVEGCACPDGSVMSASGACVPPENCGCVDRDTGVSYAPGDSVAKGCGTCVCESGTWTCDGLDCPANECKVNEEYSTCASGDQCRKTCANMHEFEGCSPATCYGGCVCTESTVWNGTSCVLPTSCPCHHGGHSYEEGAVIQTDECHSCTCENSKWSCHERNCHGVCTAWGDPHYKTFDGKLFDFQGDCDYVLVTDSVSQASGIAFFHVVIGNIPCGTSGVTCTKSITFTIGTGANQEKMQLVRGKPVPQSAGSFQISLVGSYVYVHTKIGITLIWDQGTWIQVKLDPMYKGKVGGLCGNFNDLVSDDFLSPAGGLPETSSIDFGDGWKVHEYCPRPSHILHPCIQNPFRRAWAMRQCSVIKSELFEDCHSEVNYRPYYTRCVFDTCGCDYGGDCECLCTAISAYAQECNANGVPIRWRSNDLCPIQCDGCREYDPCIPVCNVCGHEGRWDENGECPDTCVEGCNCPPDQFYQDGECVEECAVTTPPATTPYITTPPPWETTTTPHADFTTPTEESTTRPITHLPTTTERSTTAGPTTSESPSSVAATTPGFLTPPPYTPPFNACYCSGYGDPHYKDFNGNDFDHQGNCTYILSRDIRHTPSRYIVLIHTMECERFPGTTCPKDIEIDYKGFNIILLSDFSPKGEYLLVVDNILYVPPFNHSEFIVFQAGIDFIFQGFEIGLEVRFIPYSNGYFSVEVPEAQFFNSTDGLCGNCGVNDTTCEQDTNCCDLVFPPEDRENCGCEEITTPCPPTDGSIEWCSHIYDPEFVPCHNYVDPESFFKDCLYDHCYANDTTCWSFEAYAIACSRHGICLDWRADDFCPMDCHEPMEYRECACPTEEFPSCTTYDPADPMCGTEPVSGCFCPEGTMPVGDTTCVPCPTPTVPATPATTTTECVEKWYYACIWSIWYNDEAGGQLASDADEETESLADIQHIPGFPAFCVFPKDVECRTVDTHLFANETDDAATCDVNRGLFCKNSPNTPRCRDYEVRFLCCGQIHTVTCGTQEPPETTPAPPPPPPPTPAPQSTTEPPFSTFVPPPTTAEPPTTSGPPGDTTTSVTLPPSSTGKGEPPGTRPPRPTPPSTTANPPGTTECVEQWIKVCAWSIWFDGESGSQIANDADGETELVSDIQHFPEYPDNCASPEDLECRTVDTHEFANETDDGAICDLKGLICKNLPGLPRCRNYEVRFLCCVLIPKVTCSTRAPPETTAAPTTVEPPGTTAAPPGTTGAPPGTTSGPPGTTTGPPGTTAAPPGTTSGPPSTTAAPPVTTEAPPSTTECVEQWIKVCAWSIWFDGESGSQIASDADGETELVSDIQHFPEYPDNCATPEDIECRTVDTDEFANETDDGAICDLKGLICKNLPGLPRCRNYKIRLLCCVLIPKVTCSTRAPPETTAGPPGTTVAPPGTTGAPPGTTSGPPGTTVGPPGTTVAPPGTTTGPPGTTAAPPGTTSGPPSTTAAPPQTTGAPPSTTECVEQWIKVCAWSIWFDGESGSQIASDADGETELVSDIQHFPEYPDNCATPEDIECRTVDTDEFANETDDGAICDLKGLICKNLPGLPRCRNYKIRLLCCVLIPKVTCSTRAPPETTAGPPGTTVAPPGTTGAPPGTTSGPPGTTVRPPGTTVAPPGTTTGPPGTTAAPPGTTSGPPSTTAAPPQTTGAPPSTTECVEQWIKVCAWSIWFDGESGSQIASDADGETELVSDIQHFPEYPDNCATPEDIECRTVDTDEFANETDDGAICDLKGLICKNLPGLPRCRNYKIRLLCCVLIPKVTCSTRAPPETTAGPPGTTVAPPGTTGAPPATTSGPPGTTVRPPSTTVAPPGTTTGPPGTTAAPPGTTSGPPSTTAAPPQTTGAPPSTTECVEQWIKVCAWSIWFDGESGSQIASDADGETELVSDIQHYPDYPDNCATPEDIECRTVDTDEFANETDDGALCDLKGLICKNLPGLPRCRNYKIRLLCCVLIPKVTCSTRSPPETTAGPPGTTAAPPGTTSGPPGTTVGPPSTTAAPPGTTVGPPGTTAAPPGTTIGPPGTTTGPPGTTAAPPGTTAGPPGTTAGPPGTTSGPPGTTAAPPGTTSGPPSTTAAPPQTTGAPPSTTECVEQWIKVCAWSIWFDGESGSQIASDADGETELVSDIQHFPEYPDNCATPEDIECRTVDTDEFANETDDGAICDLKGLICKNLPGLPRCRNYKIRLLCCVLIPKVTCSTRAPPETTAGPPGTTAAPPGTTSGPPGTTVGPPSTTAAPPGTTVGPPGTTAAPPGTTIGPPGTTTGPPGTTAAPPGTTSGPPGTTAGPPGTTAGPPSTTIGPPGTTAAPPGTTSGPPSTTAGPPQTTGAPPSTTECVEQWIKVCAWSIWFDGESGSQIASDADGETELVSDIQHYPDYPDNCATPEDIECRTVDTDEFANETDDGALCDLKGLICKNLPGLPRCRNYKIRLLCCVLIPKVTCSTRSPPETTAGPPGTTAAPPGTTSGPPGTTVGPPSTTAAPPGTTVGPPGTTAAPPGTTIGPPGTTTGPPGTTAAPPGTTAGPPGTTAGPPGTTSGPPGTTAAPPGTTSGPPSTTAAPPQTTGAPPSTTECVEQWIKVCAWSIWFDGESGSQIASDADGETELVSDIQHFPEYPDNCATPEDIECRTVDTDEFANETDDGAICDLKGLICKNLPGLPRCRNYKIRLLCCVLIPKVTCSTRAPPETTAGPPGTTAAPPGTTSGPPGTTVGPPSTTAAPPGTTVGPPGTTAAPPGTTIGPPGTTTGPPGTTAAPPGTTSGPPGTTAGPPGTTAGPPSTTIGPPGTTAAPPGTTSGPPSTTAGPPQTTEAPPSTTECVEQWIKVCAWSIWFDGESGSQIASDADGETELVSDIQHYPDYPDNCATPEDIECRTVDTDEFANETDDGALCDLKGLICKNLPGLPRCRNYKIRLLCCVLIPKVTCSTRSPPETTAGPPGTTAAPPGTTSGPPGTTVGPPSTTAAPPGTTVGPPGTTAAPPGTTIGPPGTTTGPPGTTAAPPGTTAGPPGTTAGPPGTTSGPPGTTAAPPGTTSGPPSTTAAPPQTTGAPPSTTECVEQWIKVCAWSIWFDGESGSQIASDADGETELVSDIQHYPDYPDNCATPEDIECRTVDTDEFANETDDGALCDLKGLICKNLPGLPRCRNYKIRLLCCVLIPKVTCSTRAPPETTAGPPGTTAAPPGTTAAPPGTTAGPPGTTSAPPGTTSGPPGTTAAPPGTTSGPPGTTAAPPGTTIGPPGTTAAPPGTTAGPPGTTAAPPGTTAGPPGTTSAPPGTTSGPPSTTPAPPQTTGAPPSTTECVEQWIKVCAWSIWFDGESGSQIASDADGETELVSDIQHYPDYPDNCATPEDIECRTVDTDEFANETDDGALCDLKGLICKNLPGLPRCRNYKIRLLCCVLIPKVTCSTRSPPETTAGPPGTTAAPPGTTAAPPGTTAGPPGTTAAPPGTTIGPPGTTAGPPGTTSAPPGTTSGPPGTTAAPPGTTAGPPGTTAAPPGTTSGPPGTTAAPPGTTAGPPGTTAAPPGTTSGPPGTTAGPPGTTAAPPGTTAGPPGTTAAPPGTTAGPPGTTAAPPGTTSGPPGTTAGPPGTTSAPPGTTSGPSGTTAAPPGTTAGPPGTTAAPPGTTSGPPGTTAAPPGTTSGPPGTTAAPPGTTIGPPGTTAAPPGTTAGPPGTTAAPPGTTSGPPGTTAAPPGTTAGPPGTTSAPPGTTSGPPSTTPSPPQTTGAPPSTTECVEQWIKVCAWSIWFDGESGSQIASDADGETELVSDIQHYPDYPDNCATPEDIECRTVDTDEFANETDDGALCDLKGLICKNLPGLPRCRNYKIRLLCCVLIPKVTCSTRSPPETTAAPTTAGPPGTTAAPPGTTGAPPGTTSGPPGTTAGPPSTTAAPPGTTAGPPGTTAAPPGTTSGPPGTTAGPPGTTAAPPGTTSGPPGTTAAPPGTTAGPPGTTAAPPGTTSGPPGTTAGPPGTTAAPPGTTTGPPGTTAAPPGTTAGPPGTTSAPPGTTSGPPSTTPAPPQTTGAPPSTTECVEQWIKVCAWSIWFDGESGSQIASDADGETELVSDIQHYPDYPDNCATPEDIECRTVDTDEFANETDDGALCDLKGLICKNLPGLPRCRNYKIRLLCCVLIPKVTCSTRSPPETTAAPTTAGPPGTTAAPPGTTGAPPGTTSGPPGTTAGPPSTTAAPPGTTAGPPGTTAAPPGATSGPPGTTAGPPGTTAAPPGTTSGPPGTTAAPPGTTAGPPGTTAAPPGTTSGPPGTTAGPPGTTAAPPGTTTGPPGTTAAPPGTTAGPPGTTSAPPGTTSGPPSTTPAPPQTTGAPPSTTECVEQWIKVCAWSIWFDGESGSQIASDADGETELVSDIQHYPDYPDNCATPEDIECRTVDTDEFANETDDGALCDLKGLICKNLPGLPRCRNYKIRLLCCVLIPKVTCSTRSPPETTAAPTTAGPPGTTAAPPGTTGAPPGTTSGPPGTTAGPPSTTAAPPGTTAGPPGTTAAPPGTTSGPPGTTAGPPGTTAAPPGTTSGPPGTTAAPPGTTAGPPGTTAAPPGTTSGPPGTTAGPPGTTAAPPGTTTGPPGTTAAPPGTTAGPPGTTSAPPGTTSGPPSTTPAPPQTTGAPPSTTECVEQWIKVCAWSIWFDGESGSQITSDADGETELVSDIQHYPDYPDNCATPEDIECRTVDTDEFANETDDGALCDLKGLICKNLPGLPRCRNYKIRLLCCVLIPKVTCSTRSPPETTAAPTTAGPPGTTAAPPGTTGAPPGTTSGPPGTTAGPPSTTAAPPGTTAGPPGTTAAPPGTTIGPPGTTAGPPGTTAAPPGTTSGPPGTTAGPPGTTAAPPGTTSGPPGTTAAPPGTTTGPPGTTAAPPGTTSGPPGTTAGPPGTTAAPPGTTTGPPGTTAAPPGTTAGPPGTTSAPPGTTSGPPSTTPAPPQTTGAPPSTTECVEQWIKVCAWSIWFDGESGSQIASDADGETELVSDIQHYPDYPDNCATPEDIECRTVDTDEFANETDDGALCDLKGLICKNLPGLPRCRNYKIRLLCCVLIPKVTCSTRSPPETTAAPTTAGPPGTTAAPPGTTGAPPGTTSGPPGTTAGPPSTTAAPPGTTAGPPGTTVAPPGTTSGPPGTTAGPPGTTAAPPGTTSGPPGTTAAPPGTTAGPPGTTAAPPGTTSGPPGTTAGPPGTTAAPPGTTSGPPGTTAAPPGTTAGPPGTTAAPPGTTSGPPGTTARPPGTTAAPPGTTTGPPGTTAAPPGTTAGPPGTTSAPPGTTSGPPSTTPAPPQTTGAPPSTTECVEQWIKVCAWSIWFDGESGSQIASDADGETELVSDIQHYPDYPDNCATPEDIECRTVDTDEFANETDDGALCDLKGLICKNLPGLPRCRNYKIRLLCCVLIPKVTCSTRSPPETTAAPTTAGPPGTTAAPPGTTGAPPGTTSGPPGTTAGPPSTTAAPPGTTAGPPGTTAAPPGTTIGPPGTTAGPPGTTAAPPGTTSGPPGTTGGPPGTTAAPPGTTSGPPGTTAAPPGTTAGPPGTTAAPPGTTAGPPGTTAAPPGTTAGPPGTTAAPPGTTAGPPGTTSAPPGTTSGPPPSTTECVEQWIKVCAWSIWFDGESGSQIASDADGETELVSDIQHYPEYPDNCATPEDIECRTVDTDEFANETDDGALCDLKGLICKNLPGLPRCRNYKIRLLCCVLIPKVTCSTRAPPETTAAPTTAGPPGTTAAPPGTTGTPPGTTSGPPGTTSGPPGTTVAPPGTTIGPPGTTTGPPGSTDAGPPPTFTSPPSTTKCVPSWVIVCVWSVWFDDDRGIQSQYAPQEEVELLADIRHLPDFPQECEHPRDIECRTVDTHVFANETSDGATCDIETGLQCQNYPRMPTCNDYEVRFECCRKHYTVTCVTPEPPTTTSVTTSPEQTTEGCHIEEVCEWTPWCDDEEPDGKVTPYDVGEFEIIDDCRAKIDFCEEPSDIECQMSQFPNLDTSIVPQEVTCDVDFGLVCLHSESQPSCLDFRIRFLCCQNVTVGPNCPTTLPVTETTTEEEQTPSPTPTPVVTEESTTPPKDVCSSRTSSESTLISYRNCTSMEPVYLTECAGNCPSTYSFDSIIDGVPTMDEDCTCCRPSSVIEEQIELQCPDNSKLVISIPVIAECTCHPVSCPAVGGYGKK
ncbi:uncharacterized protein [Diadema antillarum]|uniref:uncharacterized protein isoform X1 n=1 Tax=Diadema antillarum TaxID=105358 RepID=UPI003A8A75A9